jgi:hypothetical protein
MATCIVRKGFLTLRDCGETAATNCATCGRPACPKHLSPSTGFTVCLECASKKATDQPVLEDDDYGSDWAYRYRRRYYSAGYIPIYMGSSTYDDYDVRSFDSDMNDIAQDQDDSSTASFGDS